MRFAAKPYLPFNSSDPASYVVASAFHQPVNNRETLNAYIRTLGKDPDVIWKNIETIISDVYVTKAPAISEVTKKFGSSRQFFEMVRFDFMVDSDLNVYLMEVNMSPNLAANSRHQLRSWFEYVVFNTLSVAGLANSFGSLKPTGDLGVPLVEDKDLVVFNDVCSSDECRRSCSQVECRVCFFCLSRHLKSVLKDAVFEHRSRWNMKRLIPSQKRDTVSTDINAIQKQWFHGKCQQDISWCS